MTARAEVVLDARGHAWTGIGRYVRGLLAHLDWPGLHVLHVRGEPPPAGARRAGTLAVRARPFGLAEQVELAAVLARRRCRLLHSPHVNVPVLFRGIQVTTFYDAAFDVVPDDAPSRWTRLAHRALARAALRRSARVLVVSESARHDLLRHYRVDPGRVRVVPLGVDVEAWRRARAAAPETAPAGERFALYVGLLRPRKNVPALLEAVRRVNRDLGVPLHLVMVGPPDRRFLDLPALVARLGLERRVRHLGWVSDAALARLYGAASLVVVPSRYEGFGLPVLEAMACRAPVVAADIPALREVGGDAVVFADPEDPGALAAALARVAAGGDLRRDLVARGEARVEGFDIRACARRTAAAYREALAAPGEP